MNNWVILSKVATESKGAILVSVCGQKPVSFSYGKGAAFEHVGKARYAAESYARDMAKEFKAEIHNEELQELVGILNQFA
jgi:hypothetical protein